MSNTIKPSWDMRFAQVDEIAASHQNHNSIDSPLIPDKIIEGTKRLIGILKANNVSPPDCMTGTVDSTICLEWHNLAPHREIMEMDVIDSNKYEWFGFVDGKAVEFGEVTF